MVRQFPDSKGLPERALIESLYGTDLSESPCYVMECKLPLNEDSYVGDVGTIPRLGPGRHFMFGVMLNDNDVGGTDVQKYEVWPGTWNMFAPTDAGAKAICE